MKTNSTSGAAIDVGLHLANRDRCFPPKSLVKYAGEEVAFSADGTRIVGHGPDFPTLWGELKAAGLDTSQCVFSWIPPLDWSGDL